MEEEHVKADEAAGNEQLLCDAYYARYLDTCKVVQDFEAIDPEVQMIQVDCRERSLDFLTRDTLYTALQSNEKLYFVDVILGDAEYDIDHIVRSKLRNVPQSFIIRLSKSPATHVKVFVKGPGKDVKTLHIDISAVEITDDQVFEILYHAIRIDNVKYFCMLCDEQQHSFTINNHAFIRKLPLILPKVWDTLRLRNVRPLSPIMEFFVECKLIGSQFIVADCDEESRKDVRPSLDEVKNRMSIVCNHIDKLKDCSDRGIDKEFLLLARYIAQNIHVLKRQLKSTYGVIPWEEMEFCLANFISCHTKCQESDIVYTLVMDKEKLLTYLCDFAKELGQKWSVLTEKDVNSKLPKQEDQKVMASNDKSLFAELRKDFYLIKSVYSLKRIESYVKVALSIDLDEKPELGKLVFERTLQVIGEGLKNKLESPNVSDSVHTMLMLSAPKNVQKIITMLRDSLSHIYTLTKRIEFEGYDDMDFFREIRNDLEKIAVSIGEMLYMKKLDAVIMFLTKVIHAQDLVQVRKLVDELRNANCVLIEFEVENKVTELVTIKRLMKELQGELEDQTDIEKSVFDKIETILMSQEDRLGTVKIAFAKALLTIKDLLMHQFIHSNNLKYIQKLCRDHVNDLQFELPQEMLSNITTLMATIEKSFTQRNSGRVSKHIYGLICRIMWTVELQARLIPGIGQFKDSLEGKYVNQNDAEEEEVSTMLDVFAEELEGPHKEIFMVALQAKKDICDAKKVVVQYVVKKSKMQADGVIDESDFPKAAVDKLGLKRNLVELLKPDWENNEKVVKRIDDSYGNLVKAMEVLQSSFSATAISKAFETFFKSIKLPDYVCHAQNIAKKYTNKLQCYYKKRLDMLAHLLPSSSEGLVAFLLTYLKDKGLQAAVEMLILDLLEILEVAGFFGDDRLFIDEYSPVLLGKSLRNYLAHGDALLYILLFHPPITVLCNALRLITEGKDLVSRENILIGQRIVASPELICRLDERLDIVKKEREMFSAAKVGQLKVVKGYINSNMVDIKASDINEWTGLHFAAQGGNEEVLQYFLYSNLSIACKDLDGKNALHVAAEFGSFLVVHYILEEKILEVNDVDNEGKSSLHYAAQNGHMEVVVKLLCNKAEINALDKTKRTPISLSAQNGHMDVVKFLMSVSGCDVNAGNEDNETPLHFAAQYGHDGIVDVLSKEDNIDVISRSRLTPLHLASQYGHTTVVNVLLKKGASVNVQTVSKWTPLHYAASGGHRDVVEALDELTDVSVFNELNETPLHLAAMYGHADVVSCLMKYSRKFDSSYRFHPSPLHLATLRGHVEVVENWLENIDGVIGLKEELLHIAAEKGHKAIVEALLLRSVEVDVVDEFGETSLHLASKKGHAGVVRTLLDNGALVNATGKGDCTALHYATQNGHKDVVELLLTNKADVNAETMNKWTPLHDAASKGHMDIVVFLLHFYADVTMKEEDGWTPLHIAAQHDRRSVVEILLETVEVDVLGEDDCTPLHSAVVNGNKEIVKVLLKKGADINARTVINQTPIYLAALVGCTDVLEILLQKGARMDIKTKDNDTALHFAAKQGRKFIVALLLEKGVNVNSHGMYGFTPLNFAAKHGQKEIIKLLLKVESINVNASNDDGAKPLHLAALNNHKEVVEALLEKGANVNACDKNRVTALHVAACYGRQEVVEALLGVEGVLVNATGVGDVTPLHSAVEHGHKDIVVALMVKGADIYLPDANGLTVLHLAAKGGHKEIIEILFEEKVCVDFLTNCKWTPLHYAAQGDHADVVKVLLQKGCNVNQLGDEGMTPLHLAAQEGHVGVVAVLLENGANINWAAGLEVPAQVGEKAADLLNVVAKSDDPDSGKVTPLHLAARNGHRDVVVVLLQGGAKVNAQNANGETPLHLAAQMGHTVIVKVLLEYKADFLAENSHDTVLHRAVSSNNTEVVKLVLGKIIEKFDDSQELPKYINAKDTEGDTPLMWAAQERKVDAAKAMLEIQWVDVGVKNNIGMTALHWAVRSGSLEMVLMLVMKGANANDKDNCGNTVLDYVQSSFSKLFSLK